MPKKRKKKHIRRWPMIYTRLQKKGQQHCLKQLGQITNQFNKFVWELEKNCQWYRTRNLRRFTFWAKRIDILGNENCNSNWWAKAWRKNYWNTITKTIEESKKEILQKKEVNSLLLKIDVMETHRAGILLKKQI